jgi:hypothetical protein
MRVISAHCGTIGRGVILRNYIMKKKHKCEFPRLHKLANEIKKATAKERKKYKHNFDIEHLNSSFREYLDSMRQHPLEGFY